MKLQGLLINWKTRLVTAGTLASFAISGEAVADTPRPTDDANKKLERVDDAVVDAQAHAAQVVHDYNVPAGTVREVADAIGVATGVKVHVGDRLGDVQSPGVKGVLNLQEALEAALKGTGIAATIDSADSVSLKLKSADQTVTVIADGPQSIKYTAPIRDLPQTISVISQEILQTTASTSLVEALRTVPGITFGAGEGGNPIGDRPYVRGVDTQSSTFVDGIRDVGAQSREVFNMESIEVAKGPSGTYAGRGTAGGSISLNNKMARKERFLGGTFSPGNGSFYRGTLDGNYKVNDWAAFRLNGLYNNTGVAGRDITKSDRYGIAPASTININRRTTLNLNYYHLMSSDIPDPGMPYNNPTNYWTGATAATTRTDGRQRIFQTGDGSPLVVNRKAFYGNTNRDFRTEKVKQGFGRVQMSLWEGAVLRNTYRYSKSNQDYIYSQADDSQGNIYYGLVFLRNLNRNTVVDTSINQTDVAGHGKTGALEHNYAAGMEFSRERGWNNSYTITLNPGAGIGTTVAASRCPKGAGAASFYNCVDLFNPSPEYNDPWRANNTVVKNNNPTNARTSTRSLYGFDTIRYKKLMGTIGIRYDHYNSRFISARAAGTNARTTASRIDDLVNYQGALTYKPVQKMSIYGSVSSSSTPSGNALLQGSDPNGLNTAANQNLNPEKTRSIEFGTKYELFGGRALASGAFFQSNVDNARIQVDPTTIAMAGKKRVRGLDLGVSGNVTRKLQVFGGYAFQKAILVDNGVVANTNPPTPSPLSGRRFPNTPEHSFSVTSYYQVMRNLKLGGGIYGAGKVFGSDSPTAPKWVPAYARVDIFGSYRVNHNLEIQGNLLNVGDKIYFLQAYTTHYAQMAPGRTARLTLNVSF